MNILVLDGQGGRMGKTLTEEIRKICPGAEITAVGTNSIATGNMMKADCADHYATGENAVIVACRTADVIVGPLGITMADAMMGEITPEMAVAVGSSRAHRVLLPMERCGTSVAGVESAPLSKLVEMAVQQVKTCIGMPQSQSTER